MEQPSFLVKLLHSVPHVNITLHRVNDTFNPTSDVYIESLGILASIPAAALIISLIGFLLYLLTRCCDRKSRKTKSIGCQKCTLIFFTVLCCAAIGLGLYGNDDLHNGMLQLFGSGRQVESLIKSVRNQTEVLKSNLKSRVYISELDDVFEKPTFNQTAVSILLEHVRLVKDSTISAITALEAVIYYIKPHSDVTLKNLLDTYEFYEQIRWPATLGYLTFLLLLCTILVIGVARSSRCALIFFSVFGLLAVTICWLISGIYLSSTVALADFCMKPQEYLCNQQKLQDIRYTNCGTFSTNRFVLRLNESKDNVDRAKVSLDYVAKISMDLYPRIELGPKIQRVQVELENSKRSLITLSQMLDRRSVHEHYMQAIRGLCGGGLFGLTLMLLASLISAFLLTILVCVDSHTWIYLTKKRPYEDKSETTPLFPSGSSVSPTAPISSGTSTINRTLLHSQTLTSNSTLGSGLGVGGGGGGLMLSSASGAIHGGQRNGHTMGHGHHGHVAMRNSNGAEIRGLAYTGDSPPPDYNVVVHGNRMSGHQTLGRLPSQHASLAGPNNGKYATLSKQCKTLESNDFY